MNTKEFIEQVISGDLGKNDVLEFASHVKRDYNGDVEALADDLSLLAHGALLYGRTQEVSDWTEIDRLEKAASVISEAYGLDSMTTAEPGTEQEDTEYPGNRHRYFDTSFATSQQRYKTYSDLLQKGFIDKETTLDQWNAVCGIGDKTPAEVGRINWVDLPLYLATFIHNYWIVPRERIIQNRNHCKWKIAQNCFTVCGEEINENSLKNTLSRSNSEGQDSNRTTEILKIASQ